MEVLLLGWGWGWGTGDQAHDDACGKSWHSIGAGGLL